jgi:hypothetical protein
MKALCNQKCFTDIHRALYQIVVKDAFIIGVPATFSKRQHPLVHETSMKKLK